MKNKYILFFSFLLPFLALTSCVEIFEEQCTGPLQVDFVYRDADNKDATDLYINNVTDYLFNRDSILVSVEENIRGARVRSRSLSVTDGEWTLLSFANLYRNSRVSSHTIGKTRLGEMWIDVVSEDLLKQQSGDTPVTYAGNCDALYFSRLNLSVRDGMVKKAVKGYYTPVHARLTVFVTWEEKETRPANSDQLSAVLRYVPGGWRFLSTEKTDKVHDLPYAVPVPVTGTLDQRVLLYPSDNIFRFDAVSARFESGKAPVLVLMKGSEPLTKPLDLNRFFESNNIDLSNTRVQDFRLSIKVGKDKVVISPLNILAWDVEYI